ncbi:formate-dependent phosphoribosylglycinamide formyltransferase [Prevotella cerevisiae]|jgi:phosphoribosylglycinamide formyltransferase 2|uniref:Formate-dependent phosphoribosylglycinamide formyltransferase n=1 Tax=Segatella cerevisiae TaxID=2053716 RepID=A0ABT1BYK2_9BACT|nr:formate-dependent phosphoribosylglycinamide formyltransferase [Segatella cerevisiae]MCH3994218.1 formate-dependent phosphoribosylglycinamide formyltransferase [Prevotella sp.]MCO6026059.1 formate-dependent phosphoribosylglycinamide formyltransferase [Segatella cerevisiae]
MKRIMLLGSGELGKEFTIAAKRAGLYVIACDRYDNAPAMQVADERDIFSMLDGKALKAAVKKHHPDIIVPEIEAIRTECLFDFEKQGIQVVPSARAVNYTMNRRAIRDLAAHELGVRTAKYVYAKTYEEFKTGAEEIGFPCVVKPLMSSSGHGQSYVHNEEELETAYKDAMEEGRGDIREVIIEELIDFQLEFVLLTVTQKNGPTLFCPPIEDIQKGGDYRESWQPAIDIPEEALQKARHMADKVTAALTGYGIWGVEFFLTKQGEVVFSELSPRPHDTGMVTLSHSTNLSEFELHLRAIMGWPIPAIHLEHIGCSAVILSPVESKKPLDYHLTDALKSDRTRIRIFGKPEAHVGRRMGVALCYGDLGDDMSALRKKAKHAAQTVLGTDPYMKK